jgi:hypothetical protein
MKLQDIFDQLTYGELSQISLGGNDENYGIHAENYERIVPHLNMGLADLHKRFPLKTATVVIEQHVEISTYYLDLKYAVSNAFSSETKYLIDTEELPFEENIIRIEQIIDEAGCEIKLNDPLDSNSIVMPSYNALMVPFPNDDVTINVRYRANHRKIQLVGLDPEEEEIELPLAYLQPLLMFIAGRILAGRPSLDGSNEGASMIARYEQECFRLEQLNIIHKADPENDRIMRGGWA